MFKSYALGLIASVVMAASSIANANPLVFGTWASIQKIEDTSYTLTLAIKENESSLAVTCAKGKKSTTARITVPTEVTATQVIIKGTASDQKQLDDIDCSVEIAPMEFDYTLKGKDGLVLSAQGQTIDFNRVK